MKAVLKWSLLGLLSASMWAQTAAPHSKPRAKKKAPATVVTPAEIKSLREELSAAQSQIKQMQQSQQELQNSNQQMQQQLQQTQTSANAAQAKVADLESTTSQQKQGMNVLETEVASVKTDLGNNTTATKESQKRMAALEGVMGRFRFSGDIRVRQEDFFPGNPTCGTTSSNTCTARVRERIRARLNIEGKMNEDFVGGLALASGVASDPTSTNETLTEAFERKSFLLDRAYITYAPQHHKWLQLTGGKFAYTWIKTNQTFDPDLNPEGFSEKLSFDLKNPTFKNVTVTGLQLLYNENNSSSSGSTGITRGEDSFAAGGQVSTKLKLGRVTLVPSYMILNWRNANSLVNGTYTTTQIGTALTGTATTNLFPNGNTNGVRNVGTAAAPVYEFASRFLYSDLILNADIDTGSKRFPVHVLAEYLDNLNAADHPYDTAGVLHSNLGKQSHLYKGEISVGQLKKANDMQFTYGYWRQEQDSVISAFNESDQRAPTNIKQHMFQGQYALRSNVTVAYTLWVGTLLNQTLTPGTLLAPLGSSQPYLKRMQFDIIYKF